MAKKSGNGRTPVDSIRHKDSRVNIPTEEVRDFVAEECGRRMRSTAATGAAL